MYTKHFGFEELPFSATPDPRFVYNGPVYDDVLNMLRYGIEAKKGFILVTGEAGTGKTTLLRRLMLSFSDRVNYAYIINPRLSFSALLHAILKDLGIPANVTNKESMLEQLNNYVLEQHNKGRIVVLVFDEAQGLSDEVLEDLRLLGNLETNSEKLIQFILAGQPEIESRLDKPELCQFKQRISLRRLVNPLQSHEVGPYLHARLDQVAYKGVELFSPAAIERIKLYSRGIPRLINSICDNGLLRAYRAGAQTVAPELIDEAAGELRLLVDLSQAVTRNNSARVEEQRDMAKPGSVTNAGGGDRENDTAKADGSEGPSWLGAPSYVRGQWAKLTNLKQLTLSIGAVMALAVLAWGLAISSPLRREPAVARVGVLLDKAVDSAAPGIAEPQAPEEVSSDHFAGKVQPPPALVAPLTSVKRIPDEYEKTAELSDKTQPTVIVDSGKTFRRPSQGIFRVSNASFLRNKPTAKAEIIDTLPPGRRIEVTSLNGEYFRVRGLGKENIFGYVHKEDAFFEPVR